MNDTIVAISTALGIGAISIIRISGKEAIKIVNKITKNKKIINAKSHTINYDFIVEDENIIDEVLISVMKAPKTFTKEDVVEINCHGGIATTKKVLELLLKNGCRLSEPGEFTKRAFLNGRIDLIEAEGIMDIINAKTEKARFLAINQINGHVSTMIKQLRTEILKVLANIEVNIDYPEYEDIQVITIQMLEKSIQEIEVKVDKIIKASEDAKIIKNGINIALIGKPNVGKSSLLNCLLETEKAIVTEIEGTTRDAIEGQIVLNGIILNFVDTAGLRQTEDKIEKIGIQKTYDMIEKSDLILFLLNNNEIITKEEVAILNNIKKKQHIIIINKNDLESKVNISKLTNPIFISAKNNEGISLIKERIIEMFNLESFETEDVTYLTNARSLATMHNIKEHIILIKEGLKNNHYIDMIEIYLKEIWSLLGSIIGETYENELLDQLFSQFCLGK